MVGNIKEFHSYTGQSSKKHSAKDVPSGYSKEEYAEREESAVQAMAFILDMLKAGLPWNSLSLQSNQHSG